MTENGIHPQWKRAHFFFALTCIVIFVVNILPRFNGYFIMDDAYMFARYADNFLDHGYFTWNGETGAYGATSLLYVIVLIPFRLLFPENYALSLFACSAFFGLLFGAATFRLIRHEFQYPARFRLLMTGFFWLVIAASAKSLVVHFATGMDTTFAMFYGVVFLIFLKRLERKQGMATVLIAGTLAGWAWWVRPDMLAFTLGAPGIAFLFSQEEMRKKYLWVALIGTGMAGLSLLAAKGMTGHFLPHSFVAKSTGLYGPEFKAVYKALPFMEFARYLSRFWPAVVVIGMTVWLNFKVKPAKFSPIERGMMAGMFVFVLYHLFFVVPVMGFGQRFWFPITPFLLFVAARCVLNLRDNLRMYVGADISEVIPGGARLVVAVTGGILLYYGISGASRLSTSKFDSQLFTWDAAATYREKLSDYWFKLEDFSALDDELVIATTEVGLPAALNPKKQIIDIAGLNESRLLLGGGPSAEKLISQFSPDLIYMPHGHYGKLNRDFSSSQSFASQYYLAKANDLDCAFGVAVKKESPFLNDMLGILQMKTP